MSFNLHKNNASITNVESRNRRGVSIEGRNIAENKESLTVGSTDRQTIIMSFRQRGVHILLNPCRESLWIVLSELTFVTIIVHYSDDRIGLFFSCVRYDLSITNHLKYLLKFSRRSRKNESDGFSGSFCFGSMVSPHRINGPPNFGFHDPPHLSSICPMSSLLKLI